MGRFSQVQSFADDHHNSARKVPYEQVSAIAATTSNNSKGESTTVVPTVGYIPPEKVINPYGSTAGAGSGEFHTYRHSRNRELQRIQHMEEMTQEQQLQLLHKQQLLQNQQWELERTMKRQQKRQRQKHAKQRKLNILKSGIMIQNNNNNDDDDENDNEFQYIPGEILNNETEIKAEEKEEEEKISPNVNEETNVKIETPNTNNIVHDSTDKNHSIQEENIESTPILLNNNNSNNIVATVVETASTTTDIVSDNTNDTTRT